MTMKQRIRLVGNRDRHEARWPSPGRGEEVGRPFIVRPLRGDGELAAFAQARRRAFFESGVVGNDAPLEAMRRFATTLGVFDGNSLVAGVSVWRLSDACCSLGYLLGGVGLERYPADRVVEVGGLFVAGGHRGSGVIRQLLEATRVLLAGMAPELVVAFAVEREAERLVADWGFAAVGPASPHPFSPAVRVVPLVARLQDVLAAGLRASGGRPPVATGGGLPGEPGGVWEQEP